MKLVVFCCGRFLLKKKCNEIEPFFLENCVGFCRRHGNGALHVVKMREE